MVVRPGCRDGREVGGGGPVIHSAALGGPECRAVLEGSIKFAAVVRLLGWGEAIDNTRARSSVRGSPRGWGRRQLRGGSWCDRHCSDRARLGPWRQATDLSVAQAVEAEREDLAGDRDLGDRLAAALCDPLVGVAQRAAAAAGVLGGLDERPAQRRRSQI